MAANLDISSLMQRAQRACEDLATVRDEVAITRAETRRLLALMQHAPALDVPIIAEPTTPPIVQELPADVDPHVLAMEVLRMMRELLNGFPVEWQVKIVKAITARTLLVVSTQLSSHPVTPTA